MGVYDSHEYWPAKAVRVFLGLSSDDAARTQMARWGVSEGPRDPATGVKRWAQQDVRDAAAARPGRGHRTDVQRPNASYVAEMLLELDTGGGVVERSAVRQAWIERYPEDADSWYPARNDSGGGTWRAQGTVAADRVRKSLAWLDREGAIRRSQDGVTVELLDRTLLGEIARRVQPPQPPPV